MDCNEELTVREEVAAKAIGRFVVKTLKITYGEETPKISVRNRAERALLEIKNIIESENLDDFECIKRIIEVLGRYWDNALYDDYE